MTDRTSSKMVPEQLKFLVRKLLVIISRVARLLEIMVGVASVTLYTLACLNHIHQ